MPQKIPAIQIKRTFCIELPTYTAVTWQISSQWQQILVPERHKIWETLKYQGYKLREERMTSDTKEHLNYFYVFINKHRVCLKVVPWITLWYDIDQLIVCGYVTEP